METSEYENVDTGLFAAMGTGMLILWLAVFILIIAGIWKIFSKAGKPGWASIVPIYNTIVLLEIVGKPVWWILLLLIPVVNIIFAIIVVHRLSLSFGKGGVMTLSLLIFPFIGYPMLGFGSATYVGPPK